MDKEKRGFRHTIIFRNLDKDEFMKEALSEVESLNSEDLKEKKLVLVNILETDYNPNNNPIEEYSFRTSDGERLTDSYVLYEVYIPNLLCSLSDEEDFEDSLIIDSFEIVESSEVSSSECTLTNEYINSTERENETPFKDSNSEVSE